MMGLNVAALAGCGVLMARLQDDAGILFHVHMPGGLILCCASRKRNVSRQIDDPIRSSIHGVRPFPFRSLPY